MKRALCRRRTRRRPRRSPFFNGGSTRRRWTSTSKPGKKIPPTIGLKKNVAICYLAIGWEALNKDDLDKAEKNFTDSLTYSEQYQAYEGLGYIASKKDDLAVAEKYYLKALEINPQAEEVMLNLGIVYYYREKLDQALASLTEYAQANPSDETAKYYIEKIKRESPVENGLDTRETGHFIVKYSGSNKDLVGDWLLPILEDAYAIVGERLGYYPDRKITVILYTDQEFKAATDSPGWAGAIFDGKIRIPVKGASDSVDLLRKMVIHEYTHAVVFELAGTGVPHVAQRGAGPDNGGGAGGWGGRRCDGLRETEGPHNTAEEPRRQFHDHVLRKRLRRLYDEPLGR